MSGLEKYELGNSMLTHIAFRLSALNAIDLLKRSVTDAEMNDFGYLSELPLLKEAAPQVQLDLLAKTWKKGCDSKLYPPSIVDECVLHCAFERAVHVILTEPLTAKRVLSDGRHPESATDLVWLPVRLRTLQLTLPLPNSVKAAQTVESVASAHRGGYNEVPVGPTPRDQLFSVLGQWRVDRNLAWGFEGLLTTSEIVEVTRFLHSSRTF